LLPLYAQHCRAIITDHGAFVLFNVYVPNAGDRPDRARLTAKLAFLQALQERVDALLGSGRQVRLVLYNTEHTAAISSCAAGEAGAPASTTRKG
jgi:exonuclease III